MKFVVLYVGSKTHLYIYIYIYIYIYVNPNPLKKENRYNEWWPIIKLLSCFVTQNQRVIDVSLLNFNLKCICFKQYATNPSMVLSKMSSILKHVFYLLLFVEPIRICHFFTCISILKDFVFVEQHFQGTIKLSA